MNLPEVYLTTVFQAEPPATGFPLSFAIVTAWNPMGEAAGEEANHAADESLHRELATNGREPFRMTGGSPDEAHAEPGWGFEVPLPEALEIARCYRQLGLWWVDSGVLHLVDCADGIPLMIGPLSERLR